MSPQLAVIAAAIMFIVVAGLILADISRGLRIKQLREVVEEINSIVANDCGELKWHLADSPRFATERQLHGDHIYTWSNNDVDLRLVIRQRRKVTAVMVLSLGGRALPDWDYGPGSKKKLDQIIPDLVQVLGPHRIKVSEQADAA